MSSWGESGTKGGFGKIAGLAVDGSAGNLWVLGEAAELRELDTSGAPVAGSECNDAGPDT